MLHAPAPENQQARTALVAIQYSFIAIQTLCKTCPESKSGNCPVACCPQKSHSCPGVAFVFIKYPSFVLKLHLTVFTGKFLVFGVYLIVGEVATRVDNNAMPEGNGFAGGQFKI